MNTRRLVAAMLVRNEAGRYLKPVLDDLNHSERIPNNLSGPILWSDLRCRHFGNMTRADRLRKHRLYTAVDPRNRYDGFLEDGDAAVEAWYE